MNRNDYALLICHLCGIYMGWERRMMVVAGACQTYHYDCAAHYKNFLFTFYTFLLCGNQGLRHQVKRLTRAATQQHNGNKKKPKYVKLTMSSKRFNMLALHVLPVGPLHSAPPTLFAFPPRRPTANPCPSCACDYKANLFKAFNKHAQPHTKWRLTHFYTSTYNTHTHSICKGVLHGEKSKKL